MNIKIKYTSYYKSTGQIIGRGACAPDRFISKATDEIDIILGWPPNNISRVDLSDPQAPFFADKVVMPVSLNKTIIAAGHVDAAIISNIAEGSFIYFLGDDPAGEYLIDNTGEIDFAIDVPGDYEITIKSQAYLDTALTITAEAV